MGNWQKIKSALMVTSCGASVFAGYSIYQRNEKFYDNIAIPVMSLVDPELAHRLAVKTLQYGMISRKKIEDSSRLHTQAFGLTFENPIGIAAGFDKQGEVVDGLHSIGFGFVEIGKNKTAILLYFPTVH